MGKSKFTIDDTGRECSSCAVYLPWNLFYPSKKGTRGRRSACIPCVKAEKNTSDRRKRDSDVGKCWVCLKYKPIKEFFRATGTVGRQFFCKDCHEDRQDEVKLYFPLGFCSCCKKEKPRDLFSPSVSRFNYCDSTCKQCKADSRKRYYSGNREKAIKCVINTRDADNFKRYGADYRKRNASKIQESTRKRRARLLGVESDEGLNTKSLRKIHGDLCFYCGVGLVFEGWDVYNIPSNYATHEHLIPLSRGGNNTFNNSVLCCHRCNVRKQNKTPEEFYELLQRGIIQ